MGNYKTYYGYLNKEDFVRKCELETRQTELLLKARETAIIAMAAFDGKVANKKIGDAVQKALDDAGLKVWAHWRSAERADKVSHVVTLSPMDRHLGNHTSNYSVDILVEERDGRYNTEDTLNNADNNRILRQMKERIKEHKDAIKNYDKYQKMTERIREQVKAYKEKCNYLLIAEPNSICY